MQRSTERILTSHVGTLPRPKTLEDIDPRREPDAYDAALPGAVEATVREQLEAGLDVINDGEFGKNGGFSGYVRSRLGGYELKPLEPPSEREAKAFPNYSIGRVGGSRPEGSPTPLQMVCTGPIRYVGEGELGRDIANLRQAIANQPVVDAFMAAVSPDNVNYQPGGNEYYATDDEYVRANAEALHEEYRAIVDAGFVLQIDMPVRKYNALSLSVEGFRARFSRLIDLLNDVLADIDPDQIRVHICYGGMKIAHTGDIMLGQILDILLRLHANGISYDQNVRHDHEWNLFKTVKLPDGKLLMPGVVAHTTDVVEHPDLICERVVRLANLVGRENVIAGTDCGLGGRLHPEIAWAKFRAMAEGCRLATDQLWP